jgi:hypothetical protein
MMPPAGGETRRNEVGVEPLASQRGALVAVLDAKAEGAAARRDSEHTRRQISQRKCALVSLCSPCILTLNRHEQERKETERAERVEREHIRHERALERRALAECEIRRAAERHKF